MSSSLSAISTVDILMKTLNELGSDANGVVISVKMIYPPPNSVGIFDDKVKEFVSAGGEVVLSDLFQDAWYDIWRGSSPALRYHVPITSETVIQIAPFIGNDENDPCL